MAVSSAATPLVLTPARWATWVAQRHQWNGYLWLRWIDSEAILLFVDGRPRIHLWDGNGWVEGEHALTTVARRLERTPPPRWGQVPIPARWAAALRDLALVHPALPAEVVSAEAWVRWAQQRGFNGVAVLIGEAAAAWIVQDGLVRMGRFHQGAALGADGTFASQDGLLQIYRGRLALDLFPPLEVSPLHEPTPSAEVRAAPSAAGGEVPAEPPHAAGVAESETSTEPSPPVTEPASPAPAQYREPTVVPAGSEASRRFRGDERFLLAPTVDLASPEALRELITQFGREIVGWLPLLDGGRTLEEVAHAAGVPLRQVDGVVSGLMDRRLVFRRYTSRPRAGSRASEKMA